MHTDSPRYLRPNTLNHLVESHVGTSRAAIKADLVDKIVYDVFRRLRIDQVNRNFVATCTASFNAENAEDISLLMELVERASKKTPEELETEEINDTASDLNKEEKGGTRGSAEERKMYVLWDVSSIVLILIYYRDAHLQLHSELRPWYHTSSIPKDKRYAQSGRTSQVWLPQLQSRYYGFPARDRRV
jgi:hypothetical protein